MILTAYFDESGTHAGSGLSAMAGFVGNARQWTKFEKRAGKLFKRFRVDVFHTIDVRRTDKDFQGWKVDRKIEFLDEFQHIINETLESGVASFIKDDDYEYYSKRIHPVKTAGYLGLQSSGVQGGWSNPSDLWVSIASARVRPRWRQNHSPV